MAVDQTGLSPEPPAPSSPAAPAPKAKPRSPVERAIVWGGILVLLIVVVIEWRASSGLKADSDAVHAAMEQPGKGYVTEPELAHLMTRFSKRESKSGLTANELAASRVDTFDYGGILKKRALYVYFGLPRPGHDQEVLQVREDPIRMYSREDFGLRPETETSDESTAGKTSDESASGETGDESATVENSVEPATGEAGDEPATGDTSDKPSEGSESAEDSSAQ